MTPDYADMENITDAQTYILEVQKKSKKCVHNLNLQQCKLGYYPVLHCSDCEFYKEQE